MRTTLDLDAPVLREAKRLAKKEGKSLGTFVSEVLAVALRTRASEAGSAAARAQWTTKPMGAKFDLSDRDGLYEALERPGQSQRVGEMPEF